METEIQSIEMKKRFMKRYRKNQALVRRLSEKLERITDRVTSVGFPSFSSMPRSSNHITNAELIHEKLELEERIERLKSRSEVIRHEIVDVIDTLEDTREADVLELYFLDGLDFYDIADELHYTMRHVRRLYRAGLDHVNVDVTFVSE